MRQSTLQITGTCRLCQQSKLLRLSHYLPAALYRLMRNPGGTVQNPVHVNSSVSVSTSDETRQYLLCDDCEGRFSSCGESWVLKHCFRGRRFRLYDELIQSPVIASNHKGTVYAGRHNPRVDVDGLVYFAASIFWRASVWNDQPKHPVRFGRHYEEQFRLFLLGQLPFPADAALICAISTPATAKLVTCFPYGGRAVVDKTYRIYNFVIPGIEFALLVGQTVPAGNRNLCLSKSQDGPILLADDVHQMMLGAMARMVKGSKPVGALRKLLV